MHAKQIELGEDVNKFGVMIWVLLLTGCQLSDLGNSLRAPKAQVAEVIKPLPPQWIKGVGDDAYFLNQVVNVPLSQSLVQDQQKAKLAALKLINARVAAGYEAIYRKSIDEDAVNYSALETKLHEVARAQLQPLLIEEASLIQSYDYEDKKLRYFHFQVVKSDLDARLKPRLLKLDAQLREYVHVSDMGGDLRQLMSILPALPTIEERRLVKSQLQYITDSRIPLANDNLVYMMNRQISKLIDGVVLVLRPAIDDPSPYEVRLRQSMERQGFNMTARIPDLVLKYYLEPSEFVFESGVYQAELMGDIEVVETKGQAFMQISTTVTGQDAKAEVAMVKAVDALALEIANRIFLKLTVIMNEVNRTRYQR